MTNFVRSDIAEYRPRLHQHLRAATATPYRLWLAQPQTRQYKQNVGGFPVASPNRPTSPVVEWGTFQWVVSGLLGLIVLFVGYFFNGMRTDLGELKTATVDNRVEIVKAIGGVKEQLAVTNTKLDGLINEVRQSRPGPK